MIHIAPSILAADFSRLGDEVRAAARGGAQRIHVDVMDGHFVSNLSMGPAVVKSLSALKPPPPPLEVHLMVFEPGKFVEPFLKAGAASLIVHYEVVPEPRPLLERIRHLGGKVGLAIRPDTPVAVLAPFLPDIDLALCMTVMPGYAGQLFLAESPERIRQLRQLIEAHNPRCELEVDGGIDLRTGPQAVASGANVLVAATALFGDPAGAESATRRLRELVNPA